MFKTATQKWLALGVLILVTLNFLAVYYLNKSIADRRLLAHASPEVKEAFAQREMFSDIFTSAVFTIDVVAIMFVLYLVVKALLRKMKSSNKTDQ